MIFSVGIVKISSPRTTMSAKKPGLIAPRFFSSKEFEINIYGNGVEKINEEVYRLVEVN